MAVKRISDHTRDSFPQFNDNFTVMVNEFDWDILPHTFVNVTAGTLELGMNEVTAQGYNIVAMVIFVTSRFICTFLLKYISPGGLLMTLAIGGGLLVEAAVRTATDVRAVAAEYRVVYDSMSNKDLWRTCRKTFLRNLTCLILRGLTKLRVLLVADW